MDLDATLDQLSQDPFAQLDVAEVALRLACDEYPTVDVEAYLAEVDAMAYEAQTYLTGSLEAQVAGLCRYLFHDMGFRGNEQDYYDPANSYFHLVLDRRKGIPISLSAVALAVGTRAGLQMQGVGLPGHFIVKVIGDEEEVFFDPFHGGRRLAPSDCELFVQQVTGKPFEATEASLSGIPLALMLQRMLNNLKGVYLGRGEFPRAIRVLQRLRQLDPDDPLLRRDLGSCLLHMGQEGKAIDHLMAYLEAAPQAHDGESVEKLLRHARRELAQWN